VAEQPQRHLRITTGAMPRYCLLPGDPARAERIAARFDSSEETIRNREFLGFRGTVGGVPIGVCSTGIGGPSASIALEELANVGVDTFIRVGSAGGRQEAIPVGSLVVVTAAHRGEETSRAYLPPEFPAVADLRVTNALIDAAAKQECATVFIAATVRRVRAGAVLGIDSNIFLPRKDPEEVERLFREAEARTIGVAIKAVQLLADRDARSSP
jgi:uridine phosphorylase